MKSDAKVQSPRNGQRDQPVALLILGLSDALKSEQNLENE
jgi:hypothetical protein